MNEQIEQRNKAAVFGAAFLGGLASALGVELVGQFVPGSEAVKIGAQAATTAALSGALYLGGAPAEVTLGVGVGGGASTLSRGARYLQVAQAVARLGAGTQTQPAPSASNPQQQPART